jgi:hypothetical protein
VSQRAKSSDTYSIVPAVPPLPLTLKDLLASFRNITSFPTMSRSSLLSTATAIKSDAEKIIEQRQLMIEQLQQKLQFTELRVLVLEERLRLRRIEKYGAGSEKLSNLQLEMLEQEPGVSGAEVQARREVRQKSHSRNFLLQTISKQRCYASSAVWMQTGGLVFSPFRRQRQADAKVPKALRLRGRNESPSGTCTGLIMLPSLRPTSPLTPPTQLVWYAELQAAVSQAQKSNDMLFLPATITLGELPVSL